MGIIDRPGMIWGLLQQVRDKSALSEHLEAELSKQILWLWDDPRNGSVRWFTPTHNPRIEKPNLYLEGRFDTVDAEFHRAAIHIHIKASSATILMTGWYPPPAIPPDYRGPRSGERFWEIAASFEIEVPRGVLLRDQMVNAWSRRIDIRQWASRDEPRTGTAAGSSAISGREIFGWVVGGVLGNAAWAILVNRYKALRRAGVLLLDAPPGTHAADELLTLMIRHAVQERARALDIDVSLEECRIEKWHKAGSKIEVELTTPAALQATVKIDLDQPEELPQITLRKPQD
jgi:hypothetical protein